ncbi:MAG: ABC transporter permease [Phaeodactylibacter sp.]|nr:ABC transporter permease [Phaeodactylibacter sp.]
MHKLGLIIRREYLTRVKKRSFIIATILTPLAFAVFFIVVGFIFSYRSDDARKIAVIDRAGILQPYGDLSDEANIDFTVERRTLEELRSNFADSPYDGILDIPPIKNIYAKSYTIYFYADKNPTLDIEALIKQKISSKVRDYKIRYLEIEEKALEALNSRIDLDPEPIDVNKADSSKIAGMIGAVVGGAMGIIMYMTVFIYGMMVMRSVMEEKTNRIVEVMISSVRPFQLMLGKIIGVGAVGLTQIAIWAILIPVISILINLIFGFDTAQLEAAGPPTAEFDQAELESMVYQVLAELKSQHWFSIIPLFIFYFLGGFFLYSSLFAAVGSAMGDDVGEGQALTIPITIPVVIAFYIMFVTIQAPNSSLAIWSSIFPLFSPIVMPARLAFEPPIWQVLVSMAVLGLSSIFFVWLSGRIYRVGILMYGKKVTFRELGKWLFYKD